MITQGSPLPDIIPYLSARTARLIDDQDEELQIITLVAVRAFLARLESEPILDPISLEEKLHIFVDAFLMAYKGERRA